jgi:hypothetical protein
MDDNPYESPHEQNQQAARTAPAGRRLLLDARMSSLLALLILGAPMILGLIIVIAFQMFSIFR